LTELIYKDGWITVPAQIPIKNACPGRATPSY